jgi:hypothetical protein
VANFATESNRSATPNSFHPQQLGLELFDITVRHKRRNPEEQYGRPFHAPRSESTRSSQRRASIHFFT